MRGDDLEGGKFDFEAYNAEKISQDECMAEEIINKLGQPCPLRQNDPLQWFYRNIELHREKVVVVKLGWKLKDLAREEQ